MRIVRSTLALGLFAGAPWLAVAQAPLAVAADARAVPGGAVVISIRAGTKVRVGAAKGANVPVTVDGWVDASKLGGKRDSFPASVEAKGTLRLRATPSLQGAILGEFRGGVGVAISERRGTWAHVTRTAWIAASALGKTRVAAAPTPAPAALRPAAQSPAAQVPAWPAGRRIAASRRRGAAGTGAPTARRDVRRARNESARFTQWPRARRSRAWNHRGAAGPRPRVAARARRGLDRERDLAPADSSLGAGLTAADLRADPEGTRGKAVRWEVQLLSMQTADPLRKDMALDEPYLIARGPGSENALLYLTVPPSLLTEAKAIPPLTTVIITARVRTGRSAPVGTPILDLKSIARR